MGNRTIILASAPEDRIRPENFAIKSLEVPVPTEGQVLVRVLYISLDPGVRNRLAAAESYMAPIPVGAEMSGSILGRVLQSENPDFAVGDLVVGRGTYSEFSVISPGPLCWKVDPGLAQPLSHTLGIFGQTGLTAYFGLLERGTPAPGETVLVSGAAGATGSVAGQIARIKGCRAIGIAGGAEKCRRVVEEFGFDAAIDYRGKDLGALSQAIREACPAGVDVFYDNVGGTILDAAMGHLNAKARIALCGLISQYDGKTPPPLTNLFNVISKQARLEGFLLMEFAGRFDEALRDLHRWTFEGRISYREDIHDGLDQAIPAFVGLFAGENSGKAMVRVHDDTLPREGDLC